MICPYCQSEKINRDGYSLGNQRYFCKACKKTFQAETKWNVNNYNLIEASNIAGISRKVLMTLIKKLEVEVIHVSKSRKEITQEDLSKIKEYLEQERKIQKSDSKQCEDCFDWFPRNEEYFYKHSFALDGLRNKCKQCHTLAANRRRRCRDYGFDSWQNFIDWGSERNWECEICGLAVKIEEGHGKNMAVVDHCHQGFGVRGLLCNQCNRVLGMVNDDIETLFSMVIYLESFYEDKKTKIDLKKRKSPKISLKNYQKEYREENAEHLAEYGKNYRKINKEKIKERQKEYYQKNKEKIKEKNLSYKRKKRGNI